MRSIIVRASLSMAFLVLAGCECSASPPVSACTGADDCASDQLCRDGRCVEAPPPNDAGMDAYVPPRMPDAARPDAGPGCPSLVLCGTPPSCCAEGEECITGACVPQCASGVRCGADRSTCCGDGQACVNAACVDPGVECTDSFECPIGEFCEPVLGRCLPQFDPLECTFTPVFGDFEAVLEWQSPDDFAELPTCVHPISAPVVADLDGDDRPEVIANFSCSSWEEGGVRAFESDGSLRWTATAIESHGRIGIAAADLDGDGRSEIIGVGDRTSAGSRVFALNPDGTLRWRATTDTGAEHRISVSNGAPTVADLDGDGSPEILFGAAVYRANGELVWQSGTAGREGTNRSYWGGITAVADLDADGTPEVIPGRRVYSSTGAELRVAHTSDGTMIADGYPAIGQLDEDAQPEVVLVADGAVYIVDGLSAEVQWGPHALPMAVGQEARGTGQGGPPTLADFDGDGRPEIGVAGATAYSVFDPDGSEPVLWSRDTKDFSSHATGSSVFDFEGDGVAEVIYGDECFVRVYRGTDGYVLLEIPNNTGTIHEYPLVADVDADGRSEILVVANNRSDLCSATYPGWADAGGLRRGLFVYGDARNQWMRTRRVWNQHAYHVTNVTSVGGQVPTAEANNWEVPGLNNYRQNVQGEGVFNAPNLVVVALEVLLDGCPATATLRARVGNEGSLGVAAGVPVAFRTGTVDAPGELLGVAATTVSLLPGASTVVTLEDVALAGEPPYSFVAIVNDDGAGASVAVECDEDDNAAAIADLDCDILH